MAITVHLFGVQEGDVTVAHCGRRGIGLTTSKILAAVTCRECKRRDRRPRIVRPDPTPAPEATKPAKAPAKSPSKRPAKPRVPVPAEGPSRRRA